MSTWHQEQNQGAIKALWAPEPGFWKCISDSPGKMASAMVFDTAKAAKAYCAVTGDILIPPPRKEA